MTEKQLTFTERLINAQSELKAPKSNFNSFGKYKYRSAEDILEAAKIVNLKHGLMLTLSDKPILVGDRIYIEATATITDGVETKTVTASAREAMTKKGMDESQITGTASSYARKYALNGLYLIDDTKDADTDEHANQTATDDKPQVKMASAKQVGLLKVKIKEYAMKRGGDQSTFENFLAKQYKVDNIYETTSSNVSSMIKFIQEKLEEA